MKTCIFLVLATMTGTLFAGIPREILKNEDVQFIMKWQRDQKVVQGARALDLSEEQVAMLLEKKAAVKAVRAEYEPALEAFRNKVTANAAEIRARIEATGSLSAEDADLMADLKQEGRKLGREMRLKLRQATFGLNEVLTDDQRETLRQMVADRQAGRRHGDGDKGARAGHRFARRAAGLRFLLSDAFLSPYTDPATP